MSAQDPTPLFRSGDELAQALADAKEVAPSPADLEALRQQLGPLMGPGGGGPGGTEGGPGPGPAGPSIPPAAVSGSAGPWVAAAVAVVGVVAGFAATMTKTDAVVQSRPVVVLAAAPAPAAAVVPEEVEPSTIPDERSEPAMDAPEVILIERDPTRPRAGGGRRSGEASGSRVHSSTSGGTSPGGNESARTVSAMTDSSESAEQASAVPENDEPVEQPPSELELLSRARSALARSPRTALRAAETHRRLYPSGQLAQEREVLAIEALARSSRMTDAQTRASRFRSRWPSSVHLARISAILRP